MTTEYPNRYDIPYQGMTTHQLASELLKLKDVPLEIEGWCPMNGYKMAVQITEYDEDVAIICMKSNQQH